MTMVTTSETITPRRSAWVRPAGSSWRWTRPMVKRRPSSPISPPEAPTKTGSERGRPRVLASTLAALAAKAQATKVASRVSRPYIGSTMRPRITVE